MTGWRGGLALAALALMATAGCTSGAKAVRQTGFGAAGAACPPATAARVQLPSLFPTPRNITYVGSESQGSEGVIRADSASSVEITYELYRRDLATNPYHVTSSQLGNNTANLVFRSDQVSGSVAISPACGDRAAVEITVQHI